jgi:hypothetical protein
MAMFAVTSLDQFSVVLNAMDRLIELTIGDPIDDCSFIREVLADLSPGATLSLQVIKHEINITVVGTRNKCRSHKKSPSDDRGIKEAGTLRTPYMPQI